MQTRIIDFLNWRKTFKSEKDLIDQLNKYLDRRHNGHISYPFSVGGYNFIGSIVEQYAVSVVFGAGRKDSRNAVAYELYKMEELKDKGLIKGGMVIYLTNHISEWEHNSVIALERDYEYNGTSFHLKNQYEDQWREEISPRRRYALFFTPEADLYI